MSVGTNFSVSTSSHALHDFPVPIPTVEVLLITLDPSPAHTATCSIKSGLIFSTVHPRDHPNSTAVLSVPSSSPGHMSCGSNPTCGFKRPWAGIPVVDEEELNSIPSTCQWRPEGARFLGPRVWVGQNQCPHTELLVATQECRPLQSEVSWMCMDTSRASRSICAHPSPASTPMLQGSHCLPKTNLFLYKPRDFQNHSPIMDLHLFPFHAP